MTLPPLLDAHLHLQDKRFEGQIDAVIQRANRSGIKRLFSNATSENDWQGVLLLADKYPAVTPFAGIHPWQSDRVTDSWQTGLQHILSARSCGVGEIGLDRPCGIALSQQKKIFLTQMKLAVACRRPIVIHCVNFWGECLDILEDFCTPSLPVPVMIHSFSGSMESMKRLVRLGCHLSFSARMNEPGQERLQTIFKETPMEHILLETDAPDQLSSSTPANTNLNEPSFIVELYQAGALLKEMDLDKFTHQIWNNGTIFTNQTTAGREKI